MKNTTSTIPVHIHANCLPETKQFQVIKSTKTKHPYKVPVPTPKPEKPTEG